MWGRTLHIFKLHEINVLGDIAIAHIVMAKGSINYLPQDGLNFGDLVTRSIGRVPLQFVISQQVLSRHRWPGRYAFGYLFGSKLTDCLVCRNMKQLELRLHTFCSSAAKTFRAGSSSLSALTIRNGHTHTHTTQSICCLLGFAASTIPGNSWSAMLRTPHPQALRNPHQPQC